MKTLAAPFYDRLRDLHIRAGAKVTGGGLSPWTHDPEDEPVEEADQWSWASQAEAPPPSWRSGPSPEEASQPAWEAPQRPLNDGRVLVLDAEPPPDDGFPAYHAGGSAVAKCSKTALPPP